MAERNEYAPRRMAVRRATAKRAPAYVRTPDEDAAIIICNAVNAGRCACRTAPSVCSTMVFAAKSVRRAYRIAEGRE